MGAKVTRLFCLQGLPIALFLLACVLLLAICRHNLADLSAAWALNDLGMQLYRPMRWLSGQWWYRDFSTGNYQPGQIVLQGVLFRLFGVRVSVMGASLALVGAGIVTLAYLISRKLMPVGWATMVYLLCLSWNVFNLNIGYPSWYCALLGLAALLTMFHYWQTRKAGWLVLAGALTGLSLAFKVNQGAYQAIGIALFLAWQSAASRPDKSWKGRLLSWQSGLAGLVGVLGLALLWKSPTWINTLAFGLPIVFVSGSIIAGWPVVERMVRPICPFWLELLWFGLGWLAVTAVWAVPTIIVAGWNLFWEGTFLAPLRHGDFMHKAISVPSTNGWLVLDWMIGGALWLWNRRRVRSIWLLAYGLIGVVLLGLSLQQVRPIQLVTVTTARNTWQALRPTLFLFVSTLIWFLLWNRLVKAEHQAGLFLLLAYGSWNFLQLYPFADSNHLLWSIQPAFIGVVYLLYRLWEEVRDKVIGKAGHWISASAISAFPVVCIALQCYPLLNHFYDVHNGFRPRSYELLDPLRADIYVQPSTARDLRAVSEAIKAHTNEGETLFSTGGAFFNFLTNRDNPTQHDDLWPGFVSPEQERQLVHDLASRRPALILRREQYEQTARLSNKPIIECYPMLFNFIETHYQLEMRIGEYTLWSPK